MTTAAIVQARLGSSRLPGKVLLPVVGRPLLEHLVDRLQRARTLDRIVIATTTLAEDDPIAAWCAHNGLIVVRGSDRDVLARYMEAAHAVDADIVVRVTADCPLIDPAVVDDAVRVFIEASPAVDFVSTTLPPYTYPEGMDTEVMSRGALERAAREAKDVGEREHVTFYIWGHPELFRIRRLALPEDLSGIRLTVDYPADLELVAAILEEEDRRATPFSMMEIIRFLREHPAVAERNRDVVRNAGWPERFRSLAAEMASAKREEGHGATRQ